MRPEDVPAEIVEAACRVTWEQYREATPDMPPWDLANAVGSDYPETQRAVEMLRLSTRSYVAELWPLIARRVLEEAAADVYWQTTLDATTARVARAWLRGRAATLTPEGRGGEGA